MRPARVRPAIFTAAEAGGRLAKRQGQEFEDELDRQHKLWQRDGLACIQRGNPKVVRQGESYRIVGKGGVDFVGTIGGRAVAFDAKNRGGGASLALKDAKGRDNERAEAIFLRDFARAGGFSFYLVRDLELRRVYLVSGEEHFDALLAGRAVPLRERLNGKASRARALVPCHEYDDDLAMLRAAALGQLWPWPRLLFPLSGSR